MFVSGLTQQFFIVGLAYGLTIAYPEFTERFHAKRSEAALIQGVFFGLSTAGGKYRQTEHSLSIVLEDRYFTAVFYPYGETRRVSFSVKCPFGTISVMVSRSHPFQAPSREAKIIKLTPPPIL